MKTIQKMSLFMMLIFLIGCTGYWQSTKTNSASYAGKETFGASSRPLAMDVAVLGYGLVDKDVSEVIRESLSKMGEASSLSKALISADLGCAALQANDLEQAKTLFDEARLIMSNLIATNQDVKAATDTSGSESSKVFRGESYERAFFYLNNGLLYLAENNLDNAQACFKSGVLEDATAQNEANRADWLSIDLLLLEYKRRKGASLDYREMISYIKNRYKADDLPIGWDSLTDNSLICMVMVGQAPEKIAGLKKGEELQYRKIASRVEIIRLIVEPSINVSTSWPVDDCYIQAKTRGKREMDKILAGKAGTRNTVEGIGSVAAFGAPIPFVGPVLMLVREMSMGVSDSIDSLADRRQMRMVPGRIFFLVGKHVKTGDSICIQALDRSNKVIGEGKIKVDRLAPKGSIVLARFPY
ncbi:MAG: hypothetical protein KKI12_10340 [Proteobacteria bacterium]|nr:hypothetical protein [Pseudomonadota bacterium]